MRYLTIPLIAFLLSGCAMTRWLTESSSPEELARLELALAKAEQHREQVASLAEKIGQEEAARLVRDAEILISALSEELESQQAAPDKPRWSTLIDLLLAGGTAAGFGWAAVAHRVKGKTEKVLRGVMYGVSEARFETKDKPITLDKLDSILFNTYDEDTRHAVDEYRARWGLEPVNG